VGNISITGLQSAGTGNTVVVDSKPICVKYLKHALNVINPVTNREL
jgi:hypothetical protein